MIVKRAFYYEAGVDDKIDVSFPGETNSVEHYPSMARCFFNCLSSVLSEFGIESTYDEATGLGTIGGVPMMIAYKPSLVYFWCEGMGTKCSGFSLSRTLASTLSTQTLGVTIKGTDNSFAVYLGSGNNAGEENLVFGIVSLKRISDNADVKGFMPAVTSPILYAFDEGEFQETNSIVKAATDYAVSIPGYDGMALVPAVTTNLAYMLSDCFMHSPALLADGSYYTIAEQNVVVVNGNVLMKC